MNARLDTPLQPPTQPWAPLWEKQLREHQDVMAELASRGEQILACAHLLRRCLRQGGKVMFCGNGGSAADSQHLAAELTGRFMVERPPMSAIALTTDTSALTCIGNDYGFDEVFARQVRALGRAGDCLVAISTSGNSPNILRSAEAARELGVTVIGLLGRDGGALARLCDEAVIVSAASTARIQEAHIFIGHTWCSLLDCDHAPT